MSPTEEGAAVASTAWEYGVACATIALAMVAVAVREAILLWRRL